MRSVALSLLFASVAAAHMVSMSTGDAIVEGNHLQYVLRVPSYEMNSVSDPQHSLLANVRFSSAGQSAVLTNSFCNQDPGQADYVCSAYYKFPSTVVDLEVTSNLQKVLVANHVHLLRAEKSGKHDQALLDYSFPAATLQFHPPTPVEITARQMGAGFMRAIGGAVEVLFLACMVIAARSRRELVAMSLSFLASQTATTLIALQSGFQPGPRFVEAAVALTLAYLAFEVLWLPTAGTRWAVAAALGGFHGLYFELFLSTSGYRPLYVLTGAAMAEITLLALLAFPFAYIGKHAANLKPVSVAAGVLFLTGLTWFLVRLHG